MGASKEIEMSCVVNNSPRPNECTGSLCRVESAKRLADWGFSISEIETMELDDPVLQAICEYARLKKSATSKPSSQTVKAMLQVLEEETRKADIELEMLVLRKRALTNRAKLLQKLAGMLQQRESKSSIV
ncbi:MAG: hypothetical protein ACOX3G_12055 [Armatimonadota bacterium]